MRHRRSPCMCPTPCPAHPHLCLHFSVNICLLPSSTSDLTMWNSFTKAGEWKSAIKIWEVLPIKHSLDMPLSIFESIMRIYRETYPCPIQSFKDIQKYQEVPSCILILISSPYNGTGFFLKFLLCRNIYNIQFAILSILKLQFCGISYIYSALQLLPLCFQNFFITPNRSSVTIK